LYVSKDNSQRLVFNENIEYKNIELLSLDFS